MSLSPTSRQIVLEEVFDEASVPNDDEIREYALKIGINVESEPHLLYLARDGLMQALPPGWKPCYDKDKEEIYYFNFKSGKAQWEHPLDEVYRNLVKKARPESATCTDQVDEDSRTSIKEDLKSFEEASLILPSSEMYPKPRVLEPLSPVSRSNFKKSLTALAPLKRSTSKELLKSGALNSPVSLDEEVSNKKSLESDENVKKITFDETEVKKRPNSSDIRNRRNIGPMEFRHLSKQEIITPKSLGKINFLTDNKKLNEYPKGSDNQTQENKSENTVVTKDEGYGTEFSISSLGDKELDFKLTGKRELTLTGGGSVFLKTNKSKQSPSSELVSTLSSKEEPDGLISPADGKRSMSETDSHPKGILREQKLQKPLEKDVAIVSVEKSARKNEIEEDRKSVRFNLEKELKINFEIAETTSSESEENFSTSDRKAATSKYGKLFDETDDARQIEIDFEDLQIDLSGLNIGENAAAIPVKKEEGEVPKNTELKTVEPKKFKPSQTLVQEYRDIFEVKSKPQVNIPRFTGPSAAKKESELKMADNFKSISDEIGSDRSTNRTLSSLNEQSLEDNNKSSPINLKNGSSRIEAKLSIHESNNSSQKKSDNLIDLSELDESKASSSTIESQKLSGKKLKEPDADFRSLVAIKKKLFESEPSESSFIQKKKPAVKQRSIYSEKDFILEQILKVSDAEVSAESEDEKLFSGHQKELEYLESLESQVNMEILKRKQMENMNKELEENIGSMKSSFDKARTEKTKQLESDFSSWLASTEKSFEEKQKETIKSLKEKYEDWKNDQENEYIKRCSEKYEEETQNKLKELRNEFLKKENEDMEEMKKELETAHKERLKSLKIEIETQEKRDIDAMNKSFEQALNDKKSELLRKHKEELEKMERNLGDILSEQRTQKLKEMEMTRENEAAIEVMRLEMKENYQKQKNNLMKEHESLLEILRQEHVLAIEQLKIELRNEEEAIRKMHSNRLDELKVRLEVFERRKMDGGETQRPDTSDTRVFEKIRCEKRLIEDKYKTLKEKYIRLKTDVKISLEKKNRKKEGGTTTGSETEKSSSYRTNPMSKSDYDSPNTRRKYENEKKLRMKKQLTNLDNVNQNVSTEEEGNLLSPKNLDTQLSPIEFKKMKKSPESLRKQKKNEEKKKLTIDCEKSKDESSGMLDSMSSDEKKTEVKDSRKKRQLFSRLKAASTSRLNMNNTSHEKEDSRLSPVENLRRQLKKLEELEDQFPVTTHTDTYMRYPFTDSPQFGSSEIEFFKHRIHLERESVRRAKESLKAQKKCFENRQRELKQRLLDSGPGAKSVIEQIYQEEKELTDMEVSVHRTRALLGEKIIRLRHLEQSLRRISQPAAKETSKKNKDFLGRLGVRSHSKDDDGTLSDLSSHSGSSGFSSTDFNVSDAHNVGGNRTTVEQNRRHFQNNMQESSEIIQSLENLNSEIREIWEVLKKQHHSGQSNTVLPPPPLIYSDLNWPSFALTPPYPFRSTVISSGSTARRPAAQQYMTQVTASSNLGHVTTVVDSSLVDRTRSLRDWLKAARSSSAPSDVISPNQVTL